MFSTTLFYNKVTYNKSDFILTVPLSILFFLCSQSTYYNRLDRHLTSSLLSTVHHTVTQILLSIVNFKFNHVQLKSWYLLSNTNFTMWQLKSWSQHQICDTSFLYITVLVLFICNKLLLLSIDVVSTSLVVWSQVRWFFL